MKLALTERQRSLGILIIQIFTACLLIAIAVWRFSALTNIVKRIIAVLAPVIWGLAIAYLLSPFVAWAEKNLSRFIEKKKPHPAIVRSCAVTLAIFLILALLTGLIAALLPKLYSSLKNLMLSLPDYLTSATNWMSHRIEGLEESQPQIHSVLTSAWNSIQSAVFNFANEFEPKLETISGGADLLGTITTSAMTFVNALKNFLLGIFVAIYLLYNKERYQAQVRKTLYAFLPQQRVHNILRICGHVNHTFMHFFLGKTLDSFIIGLLCFIGMSILNMPYVALISLVVGFTNIIPFFGPFIGAIPSGVLILLSNPSKVIPFAIFILVLQQFDGNILGPKILGDSLGLPTFWILFAIFVGGGLFGFIGMVAFVPLFAALYTFISDFVADKLTGKGLPPQTASYMTSEPMFADADPPASTRAEAVPAPEAPVSEPNPASIPEPESEEETT